MNVFTRDDFNLLIRQRSADAFNHLSIFMPAYRSGTDVQQGPSRLKKLMREATAQLTANGIRSSETSVILSPVLEILNNSFFWQNQADGLVLFLAPDFFRYYRLPVKLKEFLFINTHFNTRPLLPILVEEGKYYILMISQKDIKLLQCTRFGYREIQLPETVPTSLAEAMKYEDTNRASQYRGLIGDSEHHGHVGSTSVATIMSSHGKSIVDENKNRILRYFQDINRGLREILKEENAPMIFAGVDYLFPIYQQANTYPGLITSIIAGNPSRLPPQELHARGWEITRLLFVKSKTAALAKYKEMAGTGLTTTDISEIISNSIRGKIETLLVDEDREQWGKINGETGEVFLHESIETRDEDLLDLALTNTILHKGNAYALKQMEMPQGVIVAAILRR